MDWTIPGKKGNQRAKCRVTNFTKKKSNSFGLQVEKIHRSKTVKIFESGKIET